MNDYLFKVEIELDDEKISKDDRYELDDIYGAIRKCFADEHIPEIKNNKHIFTFATKEEEKYAYIWVGINTVYLSAIKSYLKSITWYNREYGDDYCEDVIAAFKEEGL